MAQKVFKHQPLEHPSATLRPRHTCLHKEECFCFVEHTWIEIQSDPRAHMERPDENFRKVGDNGQTQQERESGGCNGFCDAVLSAPGNGINGGRTRVIQDYMAN